MTGTFSILNEPARLLTAPPDTIARDPSEVLDLKNASYDEIRPWINFGVTRGGLRWIWTPRSSGSQTRSTAGN